MASMRALLLLLPPVSILLVFAVRILSRIAARNLSALARAQFACLSGSGSSSFRQFSAESKRANIGEVLRVAPYSRRSTSSCDSKEEEEDEVECVFCLSGIEEGEEVRELMCRHLFHRSCLDRWLARPAVPTCPLCRCRLLTPPASPRAPWEWEEVDREEEESEDSDMMLFMACVHGRSSWFWPS